jgi:hypothetical protein
MIDLKELRVGNWVKEFVVEPFCEFNPTYRYIQIKDALDLGLVGKRMVYPIILTPEIYELCGFEMYPDWTKDNCVTIATLKMLRDTLKFVVGTHDYSATLLTYDNFGIQRYSYLHEIQNAYYALTRKELAVKL